MTLVSAVITTHKRPPEIVERALKSVLSQTYENMEVTVVDDSPSDYNERAAVKAAVEKYADRNVRYIPHEKCMGACAARNTGLAASSGEYIAFLDDDDEWKSEKIEKQLQKFTSEDIALVYCGSEQLNEATGEVRQLTCTFLEGQLYKRLLQNNFIGSTSFPLLRRSALCEIGGFDVQMLSCQDYDVWLRLSKKYSIAFVRDPLVVYHWSAGEQITKDPMKRISGHERINLKNADAIKDDSLLLRKRNLILVPSYAAAGMTGKALSCWMFCVRQGPGKVGENLKYLYSVMRNTADFLHTSLKRRKR